MTEFQAVRSRRSANAVQIFDTGVLITGPSGAGKSILTKKLITRGHYFITDDAVDLVCINNTMWASAPQPIKGLIHLRAKGVIPVTQFIKNKQILQKTQIKLKIELLKEQQTDYSIATMSQIHSTLLERCGIAVLRISSDNRSSAVKMIEKAVYLVNMRDNLTKKPLPL